MYYKVLFSVNAHTMWKRIGMAYTLQFILPYDSQGNNMWKKFRLTCGKLGVCSRPTNLPKPTQPNPTRRVGL